MKKQFTLASIVLAMLTGAAIAQSGMVPLDEYASKSMPLGPLQLAKRCAALTNLLAEDALRKHGSVSKEYGRWSAPAAYFNASVNKLTDESQSMVSTEITQLTRMYDSQDLISRDQKNCLGAFPG